MYVNRVIARATRFLRRLDESGTDLLRSGRQGDHEAGSLRTRLGGDRAAVGLHEALGDREAEAGPGDLALGGGGGTEEAVEELVALLGGDPDAGVGHAQDDVAVA